MSKAHHNNILLNRILLKVTLRSFKLIARPFSLKELEYNYNFHNFCHSKKAPDRPRLQICEKNCKHFSLKMNGLSGCKFRSGAITSSSNRDEESRSKEKISLKSS